MVKVIALAGQILHYVTIIIIIQHCIFRYYYYYCCDYSHPELSHYVLHKAEVHSQPHITYSHVQSWSSSSARENQANNQHHLQPHTWLYIYMYVIVKIKIMWNWKYISCLFIDRLCELRMIGRWTWLWLWWWWWWWDVECNIHFSSISLLYNSLSWAGPLCCAQHFSHTAQQNAAESTRQRINRQPQHLLLHLILWLCHSPGEDVIQKMTRKLNGDIISWNISF